MPPRAWKDLTGSSSEPTGVSFVVTGAFEPPTDGRGLIQLLVFEAKDGRTRAKVEAHVDGENAGRALLAALDELWSQLETSTSQLGTVRDIGDLSWEALESVLRAERCALHDPMRGGPHDRLAAMVHLGRAIGDAPDARFPASRLASLALDMATVMPADRKLAEAALRALERATTDAPANADLIEAIAALTLRVGKGEDAELRALEALAIDPERPRLYALLSEARRSRGDLPGALARHRRRSAARHRRPAAQHRARHRPRRARQPRRGRARVADGPRDEPASTALSAGLHEPRIARDGATRCARRRSPRRRRARPAVPRIRTS